MPVLIKLNGIVLRLFRDRTLGVRVHAHYGDSELVVGIHPVRIIQGEAPTWVKASVLSWTREHQCEFAA